MTDTGLPELPKGMFWRIEETDWTGDKKALRIIIVRKRTWFLPESNMYSGYVKQYRPNLCSYFVAPADEVTEKDIVWAAEDVMEEMRKDLNPPENTPSRFVGDYPPKSLIKE